MTKNLSLFKFLLTFILIYNNTFKNYNIQLPIDITLEFPLYNESRLISEMVLVYKSFPSRPAYPPYLSTKYKF